MKQVQNIAFENESIIVDANGVPVNYIDKTITSRFLLDTLKKKGYRNEIQRKLIAGELDACQLEIKNSGPQESIRKAQDELVKLFLAVSDVVNECGLYISPKVVPNQEYVPVHSGLEERYAKIHMMLSNLGESVRKGTNIAGLHMHIQDDDQFSYHRKISAAYRKMFDESDFDGLMLSPERHAMYITVVNSLYKEGIVPTNYLPLTFDELTTMNGAVIDDEGNIKFNYRYVQLKKPGSKYTTEIRTPDAAVNVEQIVEYTSKLYNKVNTIVE